MGKKKKDKKKRKKAGEEKMKTKLIFATEEDGLSDEESGDSDFDEGGGMFLEKEDVRLIYNALKEYKPAEKEDQLRSVLLEQFEEILVVDYGEPFPDAN